MGPHYFRSCLLPRTADGRKAALADAHMVDAVSSVRADGGGNLGDLDAYAMAHRAPGVAGCTGWNTRVHVAPFRPASATLGNG